MGVCVRGAAWAATNALIFAEGLAATVTLGENRLVLRSGSDRQRW